MSGTHARTGWRTFWIVLAVLALGTLGLVATALLRAAPPTETNPPATTLEQALAGAPRLAHDSVAPQIAPLLSAAYAPAHAAIPRYADFHYSVQGEYTELGAAAMGRATAKIEQILLDGLDERLQAAAATLDASFAAHYAEALDKLARRDAPPDEAQLPLGNVSAAILDDAIGRMRLTAPLATATALTASAGVKAAAAAFAKLIAKKVAAKVAVKTGTKVTSILTTGGVAAAACSWAGPVAIACAATGAVVAWVATDHVIIKLDEYYNRDEFESDLRAMLDVDMAEKAAAFEAALAARAARLQDTAPQVLPDFTLQERRSAD